MSNPFYNVSGVPVTGATGASAPMRSEYALIAAAFDKLPLLTASTIVAINAGGTAMTNLVTTGTGSVVLAASPAITGTVTGGATFSGITLSGITTLPGGGQITAAGLLGVGMAAVEIVDVALSQNAGSRVKILNANGGATAYAEFRAVNDAAKILECGIGSSTFATSGMDTANRAFISTNATNGLQFNSSAAGAGSSILFGINSIKVGTFNSFGFFVGTTSRALKMSNSNDALAIAGTLDIDTTAGGASWAGNISVSCAQAANANNRTQGVYAIEGRGTNFSTFTTLNTVNGAGASFTITVPSNGVIRLTNTSGVSIFASMSFDGTLGA